MRQKSLTASKSRPARGETVITTLVAGLIGLAGVVAVIALPVSAWAQEADIAAAEADVTAATEQTAAVETTTTDPDEAPVILVIDQNRVIYKSKAGQSMTEQLEKLRQTSDEELGKIVKSVENEAKALAQQRESLDKDEFARKEQAILAKGQQLQALRNVKLQELGVSEKNATEVISTDLRDVLAVIVKEKGATLLLDRAAVMFAANTIDITEEALEALDEKVTTVKVERVDLLRKAQNQ